MARLAELVALGYGEPPEKARQIHTAAVLHDIGKQKIPKSILEKPDKLTEDEFRVIKTHTTIGAEMLADIQGELGEMARLIALYHHEKYNGCGYWGKRTDELPAYVAFTAISDVYTALLCPRPYKRRYSPSEALGYIRHQAGIQFDPKLIAVFVPLVQHDARVRDIYKEVM